MTARERLDLPSGGWVDFIDLDDVTGADFRKIRAGRLERNGDTVNAMTAAGAEVLVSAWEIPGKTLAIPRRDSLAIEKLGYRDLFALERAMGPLIGAIMDGTAAEVDGDPPPPATD